MAVLGINLVCLKALKTGDKWMSFSQFSSLTCTGHCGYLRDVAAANDLS